MIVQITGKVGHLFPRFASIRLLRGNRTQRHGRTPRRRKNLLRWDGSHFCQTRANMGHPRLKSWMPFESCTVPVVERNETNREGHISQTPAAHCTRKSPLPLLPSGPGGIGGSASRGTDV